MTSVNYNILIRWLLPIKLRQVLMISFIRVLISPIIQTLYPRFKGFESKAWYDLKYQTGQVALLEGVLNERFDPAQTRIYIGPGQSYDLIQYIYLDSEDEDRYVFRDFENQPMYLFTDLETGGGYGGGYDFVVHIPLGLNFEETTIRAVIDRYKRDGKTYTINYFI